MGIETTTIGNLLTTPERKVVKTGKGEQPITELRLMADVYKRDANDNLVQDREKSEPVNVTIWNERLGEEVFRHFKKGCRVLVLGEQDVQRWTDKDGQGQFQLHVTASMVALVPYRIASIEFAARRSDSAEPQGEPESADAGQPA